MSKENGSRYPLPATLDSMPPGSAGCDFHVALPEQFSYRKAHMYTHEGWLRRFVNVIWIPAERLPE